MSLRHRAVCCVLVSADKANDISIALRQKLDAHLRIACAITRMPIAVLYDLSRQRARRLAVFGPAEAVDDLPDDAPSWRLARDTTALVPLIGHGPATPEFALFPPAANVTSAVCLPIRRDGQQVAAMVLADREVREDLELVDRTALELVASQVSELLAPTPIARASDRTLPPTVREVAAWPLSGGGHDPVTGLPDRWMLHEPIEVAIADAQQYKTAVALVIIALDRFHRINDWLGREVGDELLQQIAERLLGTTSERDLLGRGSGDQFVAVLTGLTRGRSALALADRMVQAIREPFHVHGYELSLTAAVGIARFPEDADQVPKLLRYAGIALHRAKSARRRGQIECFTDELREAVEKRGDVERHLRRALGAGELLLHYQPKVDLAPRRSTELEALIRWRRQGRLISPGQFLPIAEESELIVPIGTWVLLESCRQLARWRQNGVPVQCVSVNVSALQFGRIDFVGTVKRVLESSGLPPGHLELEVTETSLMDDVAAAVEKLAALRQIGVRVSVDDFGTGYSSLSYLQRLPVDVLKIDRAFVKDLDAQGQAREHARALTTAIAGLGHSLDMKVLAEGVETRAQLDAVIDLGCDAVQGYYFSRPLPAPLVPAYFADQSYKTV